MKGIYTMNTIHKSFRSSLAADRVCGWRKFYSRFGHYSLSARSIVVSQPIIVISATIDHWKNAQRIEKGLINNLFLSKYLITRSNLI